MKKGNVEELMEQARKALEEVKRLDNLYDCADEDMQPSIIYKIKGYHAEYTALCRRIKNEVLKGEF